jgi:hypothetical protein
MLGELGDGFEVVLQSGQSHSSAPPVDAVDVVLGLAFGIFRGTEALLAGRGIGFDAFRDAPRVGGLVCAGVEDVKGGVLSVGGEE